MNGLLNGVLGFRESGGVLSVDSILLSLLATFLLTHAAAWVYVRAHRGVTYSGTMARSLIILSLVVALVMLVIGNNIARAFGLFGALALIRFRTPVKDANDTVFLFFAVAIGIAMGTGNYVAGTIGTLIICLVFLYLASSRFGDPLDHDGLLRFQIPTNGNNGDELRTVLERYCESVNLLHLRESDDGQNIEFSYQIKMIDVCYSTPLIAEIKSFAEVSQLSLLMQDAEAAP